MDAVARTTAVNAPTQYVVVAGRTLAYRSIGQGPVIILCVRLRGVMDVWDPGFLDALAANFRVLTFDHSGMGKSTGHATYDRKALAKDAVDLADALGIDQFIIGGWSLGGITAQVVAALNPERVSHSILIGTTPPGKMRVPPEPIFMQTALKPEYSFEDQVILFFEPASPRSVEAARRSIDRIAQRTTDLSPAIPEETYMRMLGETPGLEAFVDDSGCLDALKTGDVPTLVISGDHEIIFPVENWFDLNKQLKNVHLVVVPKAGHGPHHQEPQLCADLIQSFVSNIN